MQSESIHVYAYVIAPLSGRSATYVVDSKRWEYWTHLLVILLRYLNDKLQCISDRGYGLLSISSTQAAHDLPMTKTAVRLQFTVGFA